ncbi:PD-(D/E)XK nuclease family protein, partial [Eubacteriales bacterium OttesenSCG-928-N14]|nr:PD-(D/E)XK nuclease family protein [Eubacteriales bacterium OttesenSCG-928-N14]
VLLRSDGERGAKIIQTLSAMGIPAGGKVNTGYYSRPEVVATLSILQAIDNSMDDYALIGAMRSYAGNFSAAQLAKIRLCDTTGSLLAALQAYAATGEEVALRQKAQHFAAQLQLWKQQAVLLKADELLSNILLQTGALAAYGMLSDGAERRRNLEALLQKAQEYAQSGDGALHGFLRMIQRGSQKQSKEEAASMDENTVQVMSVHNSKGLEFDVVFLAAADDGFNLSDIYSHKIIRSSQYGIGINHHIDGGHAKSVQHRFMAHEKLPQMLSEELRILYVALTRAMQQLIVTAAIKTARVGTLAEIPPDLARSPLGWIFPAVLGGANLAPLLSPGQRQQSNGWLICTHAAPPLPQQHVQVQQGWQLQVQQATDAAMQWVQQRLQWQYPHLADTLLPGKLAAGSLGRLHTVDLTLKQPRLMGEAVGYDALQRGSLTHTAMQHMDWAHANDDSAIKEQLQQMLQKGIFTASEVEAIDIAMLRRFADSNLAARLKASQNVLLEMPFNLLIDARQSGYAGGSDTVVQGIIDCAFEEDGAWVLVDYKTDRLPAGGADEIVARYANQLAIYRQALERITQKSVKQSYIFLLSTGIAVPLEGSV